MKLVHPRCAGIDIHKESMTVCVIVDRQDGSAPEYQKRKLPTHTAGIGRLCEWLEQCHVTDVGLESTGVYWKPVWNALEGKFRLHLCNPQHVRAIPGSKTDLRDGTRIAELLAYGKLPESFIPPLWQRELRDLTRLRAQWVAEAACAGNRIAKVLEDAQIKLDCVASDLLGVSGRAMLDALVKGETDPLKLAELAVGRLKKKKPQLREALKGRFHAHHAFQIGELLKGIDHLKGAIAKIDARIEEYLKPHEAIVQLLDTLPGVDRIGAAVILAEIGPNVEAWEEAAKLANWACLCPGVHQSAGKRLSGRTRRGNRWLRRAFCQMAWAASRKKGSYCKAQYHRLAGRRGKQRALLAVAHTLITVVYHLLKDPTLTYRDLGEDYFRRRSQEQILARNVKELEKMGYEVTLKAKVA